MNQNQLKDWNWTIHWQKELKIVRILRNFLRLELASTRLVIIIQYEENFSDSTHKLAKTRLKSLKWKAKNFTYLFIGKAQGTYRSTAVDEINVKNRIDVGMLQCRKQIDQTGPVIQQNISSFRFIGIASM